jgi:hypothetical protein
MGYKRGVCIQCWEQAKDPVPIYFDFSTTNAAACSGKCLDAIKEKGWKEIPDFSTPPMHLEMPKRSWWQCFKSFWCFTCFPEKEVERTPLIHP